MPKASTKKNTTATFEGVSLGDKVPNRTPDRTKDFITVNDRDGVHEQDVEITARASEELWKAIGKFVDLSAASSIVAVIVAPPAPK